MSSLNGETQERVKGDDSCLDEFRKAGIRDPSGIPRNKSIALLFQVVTDVSGDAVRDTCWGTDSVSVRATGPSECRVMESLVLEPH